MAGLKHVFRYVIPLPKSNEVQKQWLFVSEQTVYKKKYKYQK